MGDVDETGGGVSKQRHQTFIAGNFLTANRKRCRSAAQTRRPILAANESIELLESPTTAGDDTKARHLSMATTHIDSGDTTLSIGSAWALVVGAAVCCFVVGCSARSLFVSSARLDNVRSLRGITRRRRPSNGDGSYNHRYDRAAPAYETDIESRRARYFGESTRVPHETYMFRGGGGGGGGDGGRDDDALAEADLSEGTPTTVIEQTSAQLSAYRHSVNAEVDHRRLEANMSALSADPGIADAIRRAMTQRGATALARSNASQPPRLLGDDDDSLEESPAVKDLSGRVLAHMQRQSALSCAPAALRSVFSPPSTTTKKYH